MQTKTKPRTIAVTSNGKRKSPNGGKRRRYRTSRAPWTQLDDDSLLQVRMCDLDLHIEGTPLEPRIERLYEELESRGLNFRPHCWLSDEWFSPDGIPGVAIPFYLAHPRLVRLERKMMLEVEGGTEDLCMRILRHEAGHAIDTAYQLSRRRRWQQVFGKSSQPYPEHYNPRPYSKSYVLHLDLWYAQSHPAEDFAETFAVWLKPRSRWRSQYAGWPAMKKLEYVDELMTELRDKKPRVSSRQFIDSLRQVRKTLGEHYREKRDRYGLDHPNFFDHDLRRLFSDDPADARRPAAASFLRKNRSELCRLVAHWTGEYQYTIDQVLAEMIERCGQLNLRRHRSETETRRDALVMLTVQTMNYLQSGHHRVAL